MPELEYYREANNRLYDSFENDESLDNDKRKAYKYIFGYIELGDFERFERCLVDFNIPKEEVISRPEMIEAAKLGVLRAFTGAGMMNRNYSDFGDFKLGQNLIEEFNLPENEVEILVKSAFLENIDNYRTYDNQDLQKVGYIDNDFINSPEVIKRVKDSILKLLASSYDSRGISVIPIIVDFYNINKDWLTSSEIQSLAIKRLSSELASNSYNGVNVAKEYLGLSEEQIKEAGIGALALAPGGNDRNGAIIHANLDHSDIEKGDELGAITNLKRGYFFEDSYKYIQKYEGTAEYEEWLKQGVSEAINRGNFPALKAMKEKLRDFDWVQRGLWKEVEDKALEIIKGGGMDELSTMERVFSFHPGFTEKAYKVAQRSLLDYLRSGSVGTVIGLIKKFDFEKKFLLQEDVRSATLDCLAGLIKTNSVSFEKFVTTLDIDKKTISIVSRAVVEREIGDGNIENAIRIYENLESADRKIIDKAFFLEDYIADLSYDNKEIYNTYRRLKVTGDEIQLQGYLEKLRDQVDSLIKGEESISPADPEYKGLVEITYPNHSNNWTNFESNESCQDRSADLEKYRIRPVYEIDLGQGVEMEVREGVSRDQDGLEKLNNLISVGIDTAKRLGYDQEAQREEIDAMLAEITAGLDPEVFKTREEKIYGLLLESVAGRFSSEKLKEVIIRYQICEFEDIKNYIQETRDQASQAKNPEYAYLLQLREFFADNIKEVQRSIAHEAQKSQAITEVTEEYYIAKAKNSNQKNAQDKLNRLRVDKLGLQGNLLDRILKELNKKTGKKGSEYKLASEVDGDIKAEKKGVVIASIIEAEQKKVARAIEEITGKQVDLKDVHLGELNLQEYIELQDQEQSGEYDEELFSRYLVQAFQGIFESELTLIDKEIGKFIPKEEENRDKKRKTVEGFIVKHHASAHARAVGGVCVSGDNPAKSEKCQWNLPNFFQMVLRDKESKVCQGVVMLHYYENKGKKIITASLNPSSTYLYKVNERDMLNGLVDQLGLFCEDNDIDYVTVSVNQGIRTNRTGGEFEQEMNQRIRTINKKIELDKDETFSYSPSYSLKTLDVVWENKKNIDEK